MLERAFPVLAPKSDAEATMRRFSWEELRARLGAAHELRTLLSEQVGQSGYGEAGRFDVANAHLAVANGKGKPSVNLEISANGKAAGGNDDANETGRVIPIEDAND